MAFTIPTIFTAQDKFSSPVRGMSSTLDAFSARAEAGVARAERSFRKMTPAIGEASKQMLSMVGTAALVSGVFAGGVFSIKSVMDYENEIANLSAITGTSGKALDFFKQKIEEVATATGQSSVEVAKAFTAIGNNQPQLLSDAAGLAAVAKASITLAKASKMELAPASEALTSIMNQYSIGADGAAKTIDQLAAASQAGSAEITDVAASLQKFAPVATVAGIKINESLALIESGSKFFKEGNETGTKFLNIITTMASMKVQDPKALKDLRRLGVDMNIVTSKTIPFSERLKELSKIGKDVPALFHVFGKENLAMASSILTSTGRYDELLTKIDATGKAQEMANKNTATLSAQIEKAKNKFVTWITTSDEAAKTLTILKSVVGFLADNMSTIFKVVGLLVGAFTAWWIWIQLSKVALIVLRGVSAAFFLVDMIKYIASTQGITFAQAAWAIVTSSCTSAMAALNAMMLANPIGLIILAIVAMIAIVVVIIKKWNEWGAAFSMLLGPIGILIGLVQAFRRNWDGIVDAFSNGGIVAGLKKIGATLLDVLLMPLQQVFKLLSHLPSWLGGGLAADAMKGVENFRSKIGANVTTDESGNSLAGNNQPALNPKADAAESLSKTLISSNSQKNVTFDFKNLPKGVEISGDGGNNVVPSSSSTMTH